MYPEFFRKKQQTSRNDTTHEMNRSNVETDPDNSFQPTQVSTPVVSRKERLIHSNVSSAVAENDSIVSVLSNLTSNQSSLSDSNNHTSTLVPVNVVNPLQGASFVNGVIQLSQYQQILVQIPTIDILKIQAQQQQQQQQQSESIAFSSSRSDSQFIDDRVISRASQYQYKLFQHLKTDLPVEVVSPFGGESYFSSLYYI